MAYTLVIGTKDWSSWSLRPYLALRAVDAPFAEVLIRLRHDTTAPEVRKHSPSGRVPLLRIEENGQAWSVWDSLAICETLAERHPQAKLWPDDARTRAEARAVSAEMHSGFPGSARPAGNGFRAQTSHAGIARGNERPDRAHPENMDRCACSPWRSVSVRAFLHRRLHVCAGVFALSHLWRRNARARAGLCRAHVRASRDGGLGQSRAGRGG